MNVQGGPRAWARLYGVLSECFKHPDEQFHEDVRQGRLESELAPVAELLGVEIVEDVDFSLVPETVAAFDNEYIALFEAFETPYAPAVESPYKKWFDGPAADGLLQGPPAADMEERYATLDVERPAVYQPDHLALLLEYASVIVDEGRPEQHRTFVADHLDWIPALSRLVENAAAEAPFHRRYVMITDQLIGAIRHRLDIADPTPGEIDAMVERAEQGMSGIPDEKGFRQ